MPTLPMHHPPLQPSGWHRSFAPGAYEFWKCHATDSMHKLRLVATWWDGCRGPFYMQAFRRFLRQPTRRSPPIARDFPAMSWGVQLNGIPVVNGYEDFPPGTFQGRADEIRIQENVLRWDGNALRFSVKFDDNSANLVFVPAGKEFRATGTIRFNTGEKTPFDGIGSYSHEYGVLTSRLGQVGIPVPFDR
jgi:hypothetical protein